MSFRSLAAALLAATLPLCSLAAGFPANQPIRVLVGFAAGGPTDAQARLLAEAMAENLKVPVVVENRPGASGSIAVRQLIDSPADGHTLLYTIDGPLTQLPHSMSNLPYDALADVKPITRTSLGGSVLLIHPSIPANDLQGFLDYARQNKGKLSYASYGLGTLAHIYGEVLSAKEDLGLTHVPYRGSSDAMRDLVAGRVQIMFDSPATSLQYVDNGSLKRLGTTGDTRRDLLPELPTLKELGLDGFELRSFNGFFAPAGLPDDIRDRLDAAIQAAMDTPKVQEAWKSRGFEFIDETPQGFEAAYRRGYDQWGEYIRLIGLKLD